MRKVKDKTAFITKWRGGKNEILVLPVRGDFTINWGDGCVERLNSSAPFHKYSKSGNYIVEVSDTAIWAGDETFDDLSVVDNLIEVMQWGSTRWIDFNSFFKNAENMIYSATDAPDLSRVRDMSHMFDCCYKFNGLINDWDVSRVHNMSHLFYGARVFDQALNDWDVSYVDDMRLMFCGARNFNQSLDDWDTGYVEDMSYMFSGANNFNKPIGCWNVEKVAAMHVMFQNAFKFDQALSQWDVSSVQQMEHMFRGAARFNQSLNDWDVSSVKDMTSMFWKAVTFNQSLNDWDVSRVLEVLHMFGGAKSFCQDLTAWQLPDDTPTQSMFSLKSLNNNSLEEYCSLEEYLEPFYIQKEKQTLTELLTP